MDFRTLKANEIDCRVAQIDEKWLSLLLYKDARADMDVLDEDVGKLYWKREHSRDNANCKVSIWNKEINEWISKEDTGTESFSEAEKGLASDSFKRACVNWGIGRELYTAPSIFIKPKDDKEFFKKDNGKWDTKTRCWVEYIDYNEDREIRNLIIRDRKNMIRFTQLTDEKEKELSKIDIELQKLINSNNDEKIKDKILKHYKAKTYDELLIAQKEEAIEMLNKEKNNG